MLSGCAVRIPEIGKARAAVVDRSLQHFPCGTSQCGCVSRAERVAAPLRMQAGAEQHFAGVNVAHTGDPALVQKKRLDIPPCLDQFLPKPRGSYF